ncbi:MAG: polysaccharide biosynthesis protein [Caulobacterales bacterium]
MLVPKITSLRTVDLAKTVAPHLPHHIIGIRPGEKLHEVMITEDDGRATIELEDRYVILPSADAIRRQHYLDNGGKALSDGFCYSSNTNPERLDARALQNFLQESFTQPR